jgi:hypothetical protein
MVIQHYQRSQKERKLIERRTTVDSEIWTHVRQFISERFAAGCPATTEDALEVISHGFVINLYPDTFRCKLHQDPEGRMIAGCPLEQDMVNCDPDEI